MADTTIKLSGTYDSIEAYNILEEMRNMSSDYEEIRTEAAEAASGARAAVATAQTAVTTATTAANNAQTYAGNANDSATAAAGSASSASIAATNALDSQNAAAGSASAAATSASNASASEDSAADSATAAAASAAEVAATIQNYLPLSGGTMTGVITTGASLLANRSVNTSWLQLNGGSETGDGASLILFGKEDSRQGAFRLTANDGTNSKQLMGNSNGVLTWGVNKILTDATVGTVVSKTASDVSLSATTAKTITSISLTDGTWVVNGHVSFTSVTANRIYGVGITTSPNRYGYANDGTIALHSASSGTIVANVTNVLTLESTTTVYLCGYVTASATAANAHITAVRIV